MKTTEQPKAVAVAGGRTDTAKGRGPTKLNSVLLLIGVRDEGSPLAILRRGDARQMLRLIWAYVSRTALAAIDIDGTFFKTAVVTMPVHWPRRTGIDVNMMPFVLGQAEKTLPSHLHGYLQLLSRLPLPASELGRVGYLTVQESEVQPGATQRRPGLHTESPGWLKRPGELARQSRTKTGWGGGTYYVETYEGGIFMGSNVT
jgi:hypothetical protein